MSKKFENNIEYLNSILENANNYLLSVFSAEQIELLRDKLKNITATTVEIRLKSGYIFTQRL